MSKTGNSKRSLAVSSRVKWRTRPTCSPSAEDPELSDWESSRSRRLRRRRLPADCTKAFSDA